MAASLLARQAILRRTARRSRALLAAAACGVALVGLVISGGPAASAATSPWSVQQVPPVDSSTPAARFLDVSCPTASSCTAVGQYIGTDGIQRTLAEQWNGSTWRIELPPNNAGAESSSLAAVSCVSASSCQAVGSSGGSIVAERWNGSSWGMVPIQKPGSTTLAGVACVSASACNAVGYRTTTAGVDQPVAEHWNGGQWALTTARSPQAFTQLLGVSCPAAANCYAAGWSSSSGTAAGHPLIEHWNGASWSTQTIAKPTTTPATLSAISCPTATSCTAVGAIGAANVEPRPLVEDLSTGKWTEGLPTFGSAVMPGFIRLSEVSCSAPRVCTALLDYVAGSGELTWATASRSTGGFNATLPAGDVSADNVAGVSCRTAACEIVGGLNTRDGEGDFENTGTTFAERGSGGHFTAQVTPNPAGTAGGSLTSLSCVASGFCAASAAGSGPAAADPTILIRAKTGGPWTASADASTGAVSSVSCTSATSCLALDSGTGATVWNGGSWSPIPAPDPFDPTEGGLVTVSCTGPEACVAVGATKTKIGLTSQAEAYRWNGSTWTTLSPPVPAGTARSGLDGVSCTSPTHCVAAGFFLPTATSNPKALVETWNGTTWTIGSPQMQVPENNPLHIRVSCATASACMATWGDVGEAQARWWNGTSWTAPAFDAPTARSQVTSVYGLSCPAANSCTAVGSFVYSSGSGPLVQSWNGTKWTAVTAPNPVPGIGTLNAVSCPSATVCTAVGSNERIKTVPFAEVRS